ncbi:MAG: hypothetical protein EKK53_25210 [Burkholderiales bacterium]|nr:MAG: hypothetical protein EKK53_25210 [Burkholderiales bacterium]
MRRLGEARLLWLNERAACIDPLFAALGHDHAAYGRHLLAHCAFLIADHPSHADTQATADRYGGAGIGRNGGSGRNVCIHGYLVKGVGRTPLVSASTPESHASGGAYLEECVRETIFSEIVDREFPGGALPTLAIIDTGLTQIWETAEGPKPERRTLLVRPAFLRPAHFERAVTFLSDRPLEGSFDHQRVVAMFRGACEAWTPAGLRRMFDRLWFRWAHQLAYAFVHRLPHGSNTSSNIAFDGRLADFGAMSAVPSWSTVATALMPDPFVRRFDAVARSMASLCYYFGRHLDPSIGDPAAIQHRSAEARAHFQRCVSFEVLRLCGVPDPIALDAVHAATADRIAKRIQRCIAHYQREQLDLVEEVQRPRQPWDLAQVWDRQPPAHLVPLGSLLLDLVGSSGRDSARVLCAHRCTSRPHLYAPTIRATIYDALERRHGRDATELPQSVPEVISQLVAASRRDEPRESRVFPAASV